MQKKAREFEFHKYFLKNYYNALKRCQLIESERTLYGAFDLLNTELNSRLQFGENKIFSRNKIAGRIDLLIRFQQSNYAVEIKYKPFTNSDFWDALKVLGYTAYLNWQDRPMTPYKPAVMIPKNKIQLEHKIVACRLHLTIFGIIKEKNEYKVELIAKN